MFIYMSKKEFSDHDSFVFDPENMHGIASSSPVRITNSLSFGSPGGISDSAAAPMNLSPDRITGSLSVPMTSSPSKISRSPKVKNKKRRKIFSGPPSSTSEFMGLLDFGSSVDEELAAGAGAGSGVPSSAAIDYKDHELIDIPDKFNDGLQSASLADAEEASAAAASKKNKKRKKGKKGGKKRTKKRRTRRKRRTRKRK